MLTRFLDNMDIIAALDDEPNDVGGLTAAELKAKFDEGGKALQTYINDTLISELDGEAAMPHSHANKAALDIISAVTTTMGTSDTAIPTERAVSDAIMGLDDGQMFAHTHDVIDIVSGALPVARGGTGCDSVDDAPTAGSAKMVKSGGVYSAIASVFKIASGSYVGTGTVGASNPCSLTLDFVPKLVIVQPDIMYWTYTDASQATYNDGAPMMIAVNGTSVAYYDNSAASATTNRVQYLTWSGNTIQWYGGTAKGQLNTSGATYRYIAIG